MKNLDKFSKIPSCHVTFSVALPPASFIGSMTQHSFIGHMTQQRFIGHRTQQTYIGHTNYCMTQPSYIGYTNYCMTQQSYIGHRTQQSYIYHMTQQNLYEYPMLTCPTPLPLSILYNYAQKIWIKLISLPLLEFYIKIIFVTFQSFDIVFEKDFSLYKCLQINLALRRHFYRRHDYKVLAIN